MLGKQCNCARGNASWRLLLCRMESGKTTNTIQVTPLELTFESKLVKRIPADCWRLHSLATFFLLLEMSFRYEIW
jgi:hypothetical protein